MQDKIQEIMGLVVEYGNECAKFHALEPLEMIKGIERIKSLGELIESKLCELVREPLELGVVDKEYSDKWSFFDSEYEAFVGGVRYAESAHNITSASGEV